MCWVWKTPRKYLLSARIRVKKSKKKKYEKVEQIKMARIYVWEYVNKRPLYLFSLA